jgi:dihydrofolate reductase
MTNERKVILYIAMSLDGYIARENGDIDWLSTVERANEDYGYGNFIQSVDTVIMGRKTYDKVQGIGIEFPHRDKKCYIITHTQLPVHDNVEFYSGPLSHLIQTIRQAQGKNVFIDGGAQVVNELMKDDLIDEFIISIIPVFLGSGISLFQPSHPEMKLHLKNRNIFSSGLVQLWYERVRKS